MPIETISSGLSSKSHLFLLLALLSTGASGFGSMGPISAAYGGAGFFCAIDASGKQEVVCWGKNESSSAASSPFGEVPEMAALSGGEGFLCGILANTSRAYCWTSTGSAVDLTPSVYRTTTYSHIAAGKNHVCAIRGSYFSDQNSGTVDCWSVTSVNTSARSTLFSDQTINTLLFNRVVSGEGFSCGSFREGGITCWGPNSSNLSPVSEQSDDFVALASARSSVCGISGSSRQVKCWGEIVAPPVGIKFVSLAAGAQHYCGIREDNHGIECWGSFNSSSIPKGSSFTAIASSDSTTCGIREDDLVLNCWFNEDHPGFDPPLELCSPGLCTNGPCKQGEFAFNASILHEADLNNLCVMKNLKMCSPCGFNCSRGFFLSSACTESSDRVCTSCSLCQNSSCWDICGLQPSPTKHVHELHRLMLVIGCSSAGLGLILLCWLIVPHLIPNRNEDTNQFKNPDLEADGQFDSQPCLSKTMSLGSAQIFRLSELKDATNGFKEFTELGRGSYGFVYKAVLPDGRQVAVKRANAATIIHSNNREFETELETLCKIRHCNIVNLLGYCSEMGERLLVYEYMPHGTLHDHLHGGLSGLNWSLRLRICLQAAKGLEYLHNELDPPVVHRDVKSSNILLDSEWGARVADFGLITSNDKHSDTEIDLKGDVFGFGVVMLEIISGRKGYDRDYVPPSVLDWAVPLIKKGKGGVVIDRYVGLPRNVEPLLRLADLAELAVREDPRERPSMADLAYGLEQIVKDGLIL